MLKTVHAMKENKAMWLRARAHRKEKRKAEALIECNNDINNMIDVAKVADLVSFISIINIKWIEKETFIILIDFDCVCVNFNFGVFE